MNAFEIASIFVDYAVKTHGDDISIIAYYGSHAMG